LFIFKCINLVSYVTILHLKPTPVTPPSRHMFFSHVGAFLHGKETMWCKLWRKWSRLFSGFQTINILNWVVSNAKTWISCRVKTLQV